MTAVIERAEAVEPVINAFAETRYDEAMEAARGAGGRVSHAGHRLGHRRVDPDPVLVLRGDRVQAAVRPGAGNGDLQPRPLLPRGAAGPDRRGLRAAGERDRRPAPARRGIPPA